MPDPILLADIEAAAYDCEEAVAGEVLNGQRAVVLLGDDKYWLCNPTNPLHMHRVRGVTTAAAASGAMAHICIQGHMVELGWSWTQGLPVFVSASGVLTQTPPTTGARIIVGVAHSATRLIVNLREPVRKAG